MCIQETDKSLIKVIIGGYLNGSPLLSGGKACQQGNGIEVLWRKTGGSDCEQMMIYVDKTGRYVGNAGAGCVRTRG